MNNYQGYPPPHHHGYIPPYTPPHPGHSLHPPYNLYNQQYYGGGYGMPPQPPPGPDMLRAKKMLRRNANAVGGGLVLLFVITIIAALVPELIFGAVFSPQQLADLHPILEQVSLLTAYGMGLGIAVLIMKIWLRIPARVAFPLKKGNANIILPAIFVCLGVSIVGVFLYAGISAMLESVFGLVPSSPDFTPPRGTLAVALHIFNLTVMPSVLEELVFRGVIMQSLRRFGDGFALVTSSMLFGLFHGNLAQAVPTFLVGLCIGYFVLRTGSIFTGILIHFVNNLIAVTVDLLVRDGGDELLIMANGIIIAVYLLSGTISFLYLLATQPNLFRVAPSTSPLREGKKYLYFFTAIMSLVFVLISIIFIIAYLHG